MLLFRLTEKQPQLPKRLNEKEIAQYELQNNYLVSTDDLANSPAIHSFFTDLLITYAEKFARSKELDISELPSLKFAGFYYEPETGRNLGSGQGTGTMGRCSPRQLIRPYKEEKINIGLNRLYLLNKFGHERYFTNNPEQGDYFYIDISFDSMLETCSHELAHYIQLAKWGKSSCESDLMLNNGKYDGELAKEHEEWTGEIYQLVNGSPEYEKWGGKWKEIG